MAEAKSKNSKRSVLAVTLLLAVTMVLGLIGLFTDFIPNTPVKIVGACIATLLMIITFVFGRGMAIFKPHFKKRWLKFIESLFGGCMLLFLYWVSVAYAIPSIYTQLTGQPREMIEIVSPFHMPASKECDYKIENEFIKGTARGFICITKEWYELNETKYLLYGYQSELGFHVRGAVPLKDLRRYIDSLGS